MGRKKNENSLSRYKLQSNSSLNETNSTNNEKLPFGINDLLKKKWKVFRVSPLKDFNENNFKLYEKKLNLELGYKKKIGSDILYFSSFKTVKKLKLKEDFAEAIEVNVTNNQNKKCYLGYFFSCLSEEECAGFVTNSVLLVNSTSFEVNEVHWSLSKIFDCDIQPVTFLFNNLITFFVKLLENPQEKAAGVEDLITLTYKIPGCNKEDNLDVTLVLEDTTIVLALTIDRLRESVMDISNMEIMFEFYKRLLNHIYKVYKLDLMMAELSKIAFPHASFSADGLIKILSENSMRLILNILLHITHLSLLSNC